LLIKLNSKCNKIGFSIFKIRRPETRDLLFWEGLFFYFDFIYLFFNIYFIYFNFYFIITTRLATPGKKFRTSCDLIAKPRKKNFAKKKHFAIRLGLDAAYSTIRTVLYVLYAKVLLITFASQSDAGKELYILYAKIFQVS
jgi:hypothetical protein